MFHNIDIVFSRSFSFTYFSVHINIHKHAFVYTLALYTINRNVLLSHMFQYVSAADVIAFGDHMYVRTFTTAFYYPCNLTILVCRVLEFRERYTANNGLREITIKFEFATQPNQLHGVDVLKM